VFGVTERIGGDQPGHKFAGKVLLSSCCGLRSLAAKWLLNQYSAPAGAYPTSKPLPGGPSTPRVAADRGSFAAGFSRAKNLLQSEPAPLIINYYYLLCFSQERGREIGQFELKRPLLYD
jgi:hypothetical protein